MSISLDQIREWDRIAQALGPTPVYDDVGHIVPLGEPKQGKHIYVVWHGRAIGVFYNW